MTGIPVAVGELVGVDYLNEVARAHWGTTAIKDVNTTVTATDLLNGLVTINAGAVSTNRVVRAHMVGDFLQNTGAGAGLPRFQVLLGASTVFDTGTGGAISIASGSGRLGWACEVECYETGATNSQTWWMRLRFGSPIGIVANTGAAFTTGQGGYQLLSPTGTSAGFLVEGFAENSSVVDTTIANLLAFKVINAVSNANYSTRLLASRIEVV